MIYVDTSVVLAHLLAEDRKPSEAFWSQPLVSSRLTEYETMVRVHALRVSSTHEEPARELLSRLALLELSPLVLGRALDPFTPRVRTLDALHLASIEYLRGRGLEIRLASFDVRLNRAAESLGIPIASV